MNCEIESMNENRKNHVDTLPPRGRVNEVRREWLVHEDGALAYRLQDEEIKQHLIGNRSRNIQIREDFPTAKSEQLREAEEAARLHQQLLLQQEQQDAKIAAQLADHIEKEEEERRRMLEEEDKELAKLLQEQEKWKMSKKERDLRELETHTPRKDKYFYYEEKGSPVGQRPAFPANYSEVSHSSKRSPIYYSDNLSDINNVGLPLEDIVQPLRNCNLSGRTQGSRPNSGTSQTIVSEDEARRLQEEKDEEYARYLQEKENLENVDAVNRDRLLAIETQDKELARLLQEKERAKARRARERAKQRAAAKRMQQQQEQVRQDGDEDETGSTDVLNEAGESAVIKVAETVPVNCHRKSEEELVGHRVISGSQPDLLSRSSKSKSRYPDPDEIVELRSGRNSTSPVNIAMTIDPTYTRESLERNPRLKKGSERKVTRVPEPDCQAALVTLEQEDFAGDGIAPPYMPIQGQRRLPEKKPKQKDGCKQQ